MQRGGNWDNSDVKGAKVKNWLGSDKKYDAGGYKKEQSVSIFGGENLPWVSGGAKTKKGYSEAELDKSGYWGNTVGTITNAPKIKIADNNAAPAKKSFWPF